MRHILILAALAASVAPTLASADITRSPNQIIIGTIGTLKDGPAFKDQDRRIIVKVPGVVRPPLPLPGPGPICLSCPPFPADRLHPSVRGLR